MNKRPLLSHSKVADGLDSLSAPPTVTTRILPDAWHRVQAQSQATSSSDLMRRLMRKNTLQSFNKVLDARNNICRSDPAKERENGRERKSRWSQPNIASGNKHERISRKSRWSPPDAENENRTERKRRSRWSPPDAENEIKNERILRKSRWSQPDAANENKNERKTRSRWSQPVEATVIRNNIAPNKAVSTHDADSDSSYSHGSSDMDISSPPRSALLPTPHDMTTLSRSTLLPTPTVYNQRSQSNPPQANSSHSLSPESTALIQGLPVPKVKHLPVGPSDPGTVMNESVSSERPRDEATSSFKMKLKNSAVTQRNVLESTNTKWFDPADGSLYQPEEAPPVQQTPGPSVPASGQFPPGQYPYMNPTLLSQPSGHHLVFPAGHHLVSPAGHHLVSPAGHHDHYLYHNHSHPLSLSSQPLQTQNRLPDRKFPRPVKLNVESSTNYIDEIQKPVSTKLFENIISKTLDPSLLIRCIKALAEIKETLPQPGHGMLSVSDKKTVFMALNDVLRRLHCNYAEQKQYQDTTVVNCNKPPPVSTNYLPKHEFVKHKAIEILSFLTNSEDISKLNDIDLAYKEEVLSIPEGLDWVYSMDESSLYVDPDSVANVEEEPSEPVETEEQLDEIEGLVEPNIDLVFDDSQFS